MRHPLLSQRQVTKSLHLNTYEYELISKAMEDYGYKTLSSFIRDAALELAIPLTLVQDLELQINETAERTSDIHKALTLCYKNLTDSKTDTYEVGKHTLHLVQQHFIWVETTNQLWFCNPLTNAYTLLSLDCTTLQQAYKTTNKQTKKYLPTKSIHQ